jgi:hypothetical protein
MRDHAIAHLPVHFGRQRFSCGGHGIAPERAVTVLVFLAAATRTERVATDHRTLCSVALSIGKHRLGFDVIGCRGEYSPGDRDRRVPLPERGAVPQERKELERARDAVGKLRRQRSDLRRRHGPAKIEQAVKAEGLADRIRDFE